MDLEEIKLKSKHIKPNSCYECGNKGISDITIFPSICKRDYLWFECRGEFGYKIEVKKEKCAGCGSQYLDPEFSIIKEGKKYCCEECYDLFRIEN